MFNHTFANMKIKDLNAIFCTSLLHDLELDKLTLIL